MVGIIITSFFMILFLGVAGYFNAVMDCISWHDSVKNKWGNYWSRDYSTSNKDRNHDGKITYLEKTFIDDG